MERSGRSRRGGRRGEAGRGLIDGTHRSSDGRDAGERAQRNRPHRLDGAERRGMIVAARCNRAAEVGARALRVMAGWRRCGTGLMRVARRGALVEHDRQAHQQRGECRGRGAARRSNHASILTHLTLLQLHRQRSANPTVRASAGSPSAASIRRSPSSSACIFPQGFRVQGSCRPTSTPRCARVGDRVGPRAAVCRAGSSTGDRTRHIPSPSRHRRWRKSGRARGATRSSKGSRSGGPERRRAFRREHALAARPTA